MEEELGSMESQPACDIICGDWNMVRHRADTNGRRLAHQNDLGAERHVIEALAANETVMVDGWCLVHPITIFDTHQNTAMMEERMEVKDGSKGTETEPEPTTFEIISSFIRILADGHFLIAFKPTTKNESFDQLDFLNA
ncbi:uncharacterized protein Z519_05683 [Cladophialophora bantiana CBS 173.52]|uniref:Uncharacterized protein n=1 Tax=Cladophialophora bantiana (strain ATCC 10958 / CBS 173.52 / CDC B-1940 / NIH 8579) TaxID=1442370 RepID=A0A0D2HII1_CLAB1|nr:uncharacterized protein Z519_05683 [Cladophialophora bantiana CBS 173.52]KIW93078.1 hypothetical protein Z519_05683 [Cladophialophora bantiana CBS 173.52]